LAVCSCWPLRTLARLPNDRGSVWYLFRPFFDCNIVGRRDSSATSSGAARDYFVCPTTSFGRRACLLGRTESPDLARTGASQQGTSQ
jgi:hypothetical protein